jgi:hypothetical protein
MGKNKPAFDPAQAASADIQFILPELNRELANFRPVMGHAAGC